MSFWSKLGNAVVNGFGGLVSGALGIAGNAFGSNASVKAVEKQNEGNMALAEYAYQKDLQNWHMQNAYNAPSAQMERLKDAGLNPNLMYGQGNVGNAGEAPQFKAPNLQAYTNFGDFGATAAGAQMLSGFNQYANIQKTNAETDNIRQNTQNLQASEENIKLRNLWQMYVNAKTKEEAYFAKDLLVSQIANTNSQTYFNDIRSKFTESQNDRFTQLTPMVKQALETDIKQKLFDLNVLSPKKIQQADSNIHFQKAMSALSMMQQKKLQNDLGFQMVNFKYAESNAANDALKKQYEQEMMKFFKDTGIKPDGNAWSLINGFFYNTVKTLDSYFPNLFDW